MLGFGQSGFSGLNGRPMPVGPGSEMKIAGQYNSGGGPPMPGPPQTRPGSDMISVGAFNSGAAAAPTPMSGLPASASAPATPAASPLGMWQNWLQTMGPYLAQMPTSQPDAESGGLSGLVPGQLQPDPNGSGLSGYGGWSYPARGFNRINSM